MCLHPGLDNIVHGCESPGNPQDTDHKSSAETGIGSQLPVLVFVREWTHRDLLTDNSSPDVLWMKSAFWGLPRNIHEDSCLQKLKICREFMIWIILLFQRMCWLQLKDSNRVWYSNSCVFHAIPETCHVDEPRTLYLFEVRILAMGARQWTRGWSSWLLRASLVWCAWWTTTSSSASTSISWKHTPPSSPSPASTWKPRVQASRMNMSFWDRVLSFHRMLSVFISATFRWVWFNSGVRLLATRFYHPRNVRQIFSRTTNAQCSVGDPMR